MVVRILIGLIGLGIVVFIHELGHFIAAKLVGIEVEAFSIGWGKKIASFRRGKTEYRLSIFPVGGYCKMKGEEMLKKAWENNDKVVEKEQGSFFSASPLARIFVSFSGPLFNIIFSVLAISVIWLVGFSFPSFPNRIVLASDYAVAGEQDTTYPADGAGLRTGDRITSINGREVGNFRDLQEIIVTSAGEELEMTVVRDGERLNTTVIPSLNRATAGGYIGIHVWVEPVIESVQPDSSAFIAGLKAGDRLVRAAGREIEHSLDFSYLFSDRPVSMDITYRRNSEEMTTVLVPQYTETGAADLGITFASTMYHTPSLSFFEAAAKGVGETVNTLALTVKGIGLLFQGVDISQAVTGPIRMTYYVGEVASQGFQQGLSTGISSVVSFLSFISVALAFMNLLPFPIFDGGMIVLFLVEMGRRKPVSPRVFYRYQMVGVFVIFALVALAMFGDISFLLRR